MTFEGTFKGGVVVLDRPPELADGTRVKVVVLDNESAAPTLTSLLKYAGTVNDLPPDMAAQHDHYIHGTPKR